MSIQAHIDSLAQKRSHIKEMITLESARPAPDFAAITKLKKQNLAIKEEMQKCLAMLAHSAAGATS